MSFTSHANDKISTKVDRIFTMNSQKPKDSYGAVPDSFEKKTRKIDWGPLQQTRTQIVREEVEVEKLIAKVLQVNDSEIAFTAQFKDGLIDYVHKCCLVIPVGQKRILTHTSMDGYTLSITTEIHMKLFLYLMARDLIPRGPGKTIIHHHICEVVDPKGFRFYADCDLKLNFAPGHDFVLKYTRTYQRVMREFFDSDFEVVVAFVQPDQRTESDGVRFWKSGIHWIWKNVVVNIMQAKMIAHKALAVFQEAYPDANYPPPCNTVSDQIDLKVYKASGGGLRMLYNYKIEKCDQCTKGKSAGCIKCGSKGKLESGRLYEPLFVVRENGEINQEETANVCSNSNRAYALEQTYLRVTKPIRIDFIRPCQLPTILYHEKDLQELGIQIPISDNITDEKRCPLSDIQLMQVGIPPIGGSMTDKKPRISQVNEESEPKIFVVVKPNSTTTEKNEGPETALQKKYGQFWSLAASSTQNRNILDNFKAHELQPVEFNPDLHPPLEKFIRKWHPEWENINLTVILTNASANKKGKFLIVFFAGPGHRFCPNKNAEHATANPYFKINPYGYILTHCNSRKSERRAGGKICKEYCSEPKKLPEEMMDVIRSLFESYDILDVKLTAAERIKMHHEQKRSLQEAERNHEALNLVFNPVRHMAECALLFIQKKQMEDNIKKREAEEQQRQLEQQQPNKSIAVFHPQSDPDSTIRPQTTIRKKDTGCLSYRMYKNANAIRQTNESSVDFTIINS